MSGTRCDGCGHYWPWADAAAAGASADGACTLAPQWVPVPAGHWCGQWTAGGGGAGGAGGALVTGCTPESAVVGGADLVLRVLGRGFTAGTVILFNGGEEVTEFVSAREVRTGVKPSLVGAPVVVEVGVVGGVGAVPFAFVAAGG